MATNSVVAQISGHKSPKPVKQRQSVTFETPLKCDGCNGDHVRSSCPHRENVCDFCGVAGHLARVCRKRIRSEKDKKRQTRSQSWNRPENRSRSKSASQQNANAPSTSSAVHVEPMDTDDEDILLGNIPEVVYVPDPGHGIKNTRYDITHFTESQHGKYGDLKNG